MIEIEKRALLTEEQYHSLQQKYERDGKLLRRINRISLIYVWRDDWQPSPKSTDNPFDLKIKTDEVKSVISVKREVDGEGHSRHEYELKFEPEEFPKYLELLVMLGYDRHVMTKVSRSVFEYKGFKVSIDHQLTIGKYMIEVELMAESESEVKAKEDEIEEFLQREGLITLDNKSTVKILKQLNNLREYRLELKGKDLYKWGDGVKKAG